MTGVGGSDDRQHRVGEVRLEGAEDLPGDPPEVARRGVAAPEPGSFL